MIPVYSVGRLVVTLGEMKVHLEIDPEIVDYARSLVPVTTTLNRTRFVPHITVVRSEPVVAGILDLQVSRLHGRKVGFRYDPRVVPGDTYWWLRAWSLELESIRRGLQLPKLSHWCRPPDNEDCFHITIGNTKTT